MLRRAGPLRLLTFAYFAGALLSLLLIEPACCRFDPEAPDRDRVWNWLLLSWLSLGLISMIVHWRHWSWRNSIWATLFAPLSLAFAFAAFSWPYVLAANALAGSEAVAYRGAVSGLWEREGRSSTYGMYLRDERSGREVELEIPQSEHEAMQPGDRAACGYRRGRLGFFFRWRFSDAPDCRFERG